MLGILLLAVALKVPVVEPPGMVVDLGTRSKELLLVKTTAIPPEGAAWLRVTVQVVTVAGDRLAGLQETEERVIADSRLMRAVCETPLTVALRVAIWLLGTLLAARAVKVVEVEPAGTVIVDAGTGNRALLLESETAVPPAGAA